MTHSSDDQDLQNEDINHDDHLDNIVERIETVAHNLDQATASGKTMKCGYVALIGPTNAGKSTLLNTLTGHKIAIVSRKVQTTRTRITAITAHETDDTNAQLVFLDTPGLFKPKKRLDRAMIQAAHSGMQEGDFVGLIIDAAKPAHAVLEDIGKSLSTLSQTAPDKDIALILNKIDKITHARLLALTQDINEKHGDQLDAVFMISARSGDGADAFLNYCASKVTEGPWMFIGDEITTLPFRQMAAEITREVIMDVIHQEIPYALTVMTEEVEYFDNGDYKLMQNIIVEKNSQKTVLVGKGGSKIKEIGQRAREEMQHVFDGKIHLKLFVKVQPNWQNDPEYYALWNL